MPAEIYWTIKLQTVQKIVQLYIIMEQNKKMFGFKNSGYEFIIEDDESKFVDTFYFQTKNQEKSENRDGAQIIRQTLNFRDQNIQNVWTNCHQSQLIELHKIYGNKWTLLARYYSGIRSENSIKNRFYSRLRKSIRKLNKSIDVFHLSKYNKFKLNIIFKLSNISEGKMAQKDKISSQILSFYQNYLYKLIEFSEEGQNETLNKKPTPNIEQIENLILPLLALQNLFRTVGGERVAKGKKKNIAYLRQFVFKLSLQNSAKMVISKQNIFLEYGDQIKGQGTIQSHWVKKTQKQLIQQKREDQQIVGKFKNVTEQIQIFCPLNVQNVIEQTENINLQSVSLFKEAQQGQSKTQTQIWKDYMGYQMKQYDFHVHGQLFSDEGNGFSFGSFKSSNNFSDENTYW